MGQHVSRRTGKIKKAFDTPIEAGSGMDCYVCGVCDKYYVGRSLRFGGSMRAQLNEALARRKKPSC